MICDLCNKEFKVPEEWTDKDCNYRYYRFGEWHGAKVCEDCAPKKFAVTRAIITKCSFNFWEKFKEGRNNGSI